MHTQSVVRRRRRADGRRRYVEALSAWQKLRIEENRRRLDDGPSFVVEFECIHMKFEHNLKLDGALSWIGSHHR